MSNYQPMSAPPPEGRAGRRSVEAPPSIRTAVNIVWGIVAMSVVSLLLTFVYLDDLVEAASVNLSAEQQDAARTAALVSGVLFAVVFGVLWAVLGLFLGRGKSWARVVLTVLVVIGVLGGLFGFFSSRPVLLTIAGIVTLALQAALLYFMWQRDATAYLQGR
ncbi:MAG TPA: hypothetical protein VFJ14_11435 [Nocardioidaceae bacterium]|nr:hypothetical protein [Nocardioidaceae bacterium]